MLSIIFLHILALVFACHFRMEILALWRMIYLLYSALFYFSCLYGLHFALCQCMAPFSAMLVHSPVAGCPLGRLCFGIGYKFVENAHIGIGFLCASMALGMFIFAFG